jgi:hypothetical protein
MTEGDIGRRTSAGKGLSTVRSEWRWGRVDDRENGGDGNYWGGKENASIGSETYEEREKTVLEFTPRGLRNTLCRGQLRNEQG